MNDAKIFNFEGRQYVSLTDYRSMAEAHRLLMLDKRAAVAELEKTIARLYEHAMDLAGGSR